MKEKLKQVANRIENIKGEECLVYVHNKGDCPVCGTTHDFVQKEYISVSAIKSHYDDKVDLTSDTFKDDLVTESQKRDLGHERYFE